MIAFNISAVTLFSTAVTVEGLFMSNAANVMPCKERETDFDYYNGENLKVQESCKSQKKEKHYKVSCPAGYLNDGVKCVKQPSVYERILSGESGVSFGGQMNESVFHYTPKGSLAHLWGIQSGLDSLRSHGDYMNNEASRMYAQLKEKLEASEEVMNTETGKMEKKAKKYYAKFNKVAFVGRIADAMRPAQTKGFMATPEVVPDSDYRYGEIWWNNDSKRQLVVSFPFESDSSKHVGTKFLQEFPQGGRAHFAFGDCHFEKHDFVGLTQCGDITFDGVEIYYNAGEGPKVEL